MACAKSTAPLMYSEGNRFCLGGVLDAFIRSGAVRNRSDLSWKCHMDTVISACFHLKEGIKASYLQRCLFPCGFQGAPEHWHLDPRPWFVLDWLSRTCSVIAIGFIMLWCSSAREQGEHRPIFFIVPYSSSICLSASHVASCNQVICPGVS